MTRSSGHEHRASPSSVLRTREVRDRALFDLVDAPVTPPNQVDLISFARLLNELLASLPQHLSARSRIGFRTFPHGDLVGIATQDLVAARILVQTLQETVRWVGDHDPTTRRLLEHLLEDKEAEADGLRAQSYPTNQA